MDIRFTEQADSPTAPLQGVTHMRQLFLSALILAALVLTASLVMVPTGLALERTAVRITDDGPGDCWAAGSATCTVQYYNICTGWVWLHGDWADGDRIGTVFADCSGSCTLDTSFTWFRTGVPAGWGFTGVTAVYAPDANDCPTGVPLASQPSVPASGWDLLSWGGVAVPDDFIVVYEFAEPDGYPFNPARCATDHPAAGATGPQACGTCYPTTRTNHSYYWGTATSPLCPGSTFNDGVCDAQWLMDATMSCTLATEQASWGSVKNLYR